MKQRTLHNTGFKYLTLITTVVVTFYMVTAIVQNRLVSFGPINICAAIFVYPFSYLLCDIATEVYGYKITRQILWCSLLSWFLSGLLIKFIINLPTPGYWSGYSHQFNTVMAPYFRTIMSGIVAVIAGQFLNIYAISKLKILTEGRFFWLRSVSSCLTGDIITTVLAISFIFLGRMPIDDIVKIISYEIVISIVLQAIFAIPATFLVNALKASENVNIFDNGINFNPFKFALDDDDKSNSNMTPDSSGLESLNANRD